MLAMNCMPPTPSIRAWCTFAMTATMSWSSPSTTCILHNGRSRSRGTRLEVGDEARELGEAASVEDHPMEVVVHVDRDVDPTRASDPERYGDELLAERRDPTQPIGDEVPQPLERIAARHGCPVEHHHRHHMERVIVRLEREEGAVEAPCLSHTTPSHAGATSVHRRPTPEPGPKDLIDATRDDSKCLIAPRADLRPSEVRAHGSIG